jgi:hypothetical protein
VLAISLSRRGCNAFEIEFFLNLKKSEPFEVLQQKDLNGLGDSHAENESIKLVEILLIEGSIEEREIRVDKLKDENLVHIGLLVAVLVLVILYVHEVGSDR